MERGLFRGYIKPVLVSLGLFLTILSIAIVALRFYARRRSRVVIGLDDWFIVVATVRFFLCSLTE